jgi:hypothetical protein
MAKNNKLFQYIILYHPPKEKDEKQKNAELISDGIEHILANSEQQAMMLVAKKIPDEYLDDLNHLEVVIRPF